MNEHFGPALGRRSPVALRMRADGHSKSFVRHGVIVLLAVIGLAGTPVSSAAPTEAQFSENLAARLAKRAALLARAEQAKADQESNPSDLQLRVIEIQYRLLAGLLSDTAIAEAELQASVALRAESGVAPSQRLELAVLEQQNRRKARRFASAEEYWREREASARALMAEFPELPEPHSHLLAVAYGAPGSAGLSLAKEILSSSAPAAIKESARELIVRRSIDGQNIHQVLGEVAGAAAILKRAQGRPIILYTWAPQDARSLERAKRLETTLATGAILLGINLHRDVPRALEVATEWQLPGEQLYGARGFDSPLVRELALTAPGMVYVATAHGVLRNFSGEWDLAQITTYLGSAQ